MKKRTIVLAALVLLALPASAVASQGQYLGKREARHQAELYIETNYNVKPTVGASCWLPAEWRPDIRRCAIAADRLDGRAVCAFVRIEETTRSYWFGKVRWVGCRF